MAAALALLCNNNHPEVHIFIHGGLNADYISNHLSHPHPPQHYWKHKHTSIVCFFLYNMSSGQQCSGSSFVLKIRVGGEQMDTCFSVWEHCCQHSFATPEMLLQPGLSIRQLESWDKTSSDDLLTASINIPGSYHSVKLTLKLCYDLKHVSYL